MKRLLLFALTGVAGFLLLPLPGRADSTQLSAEHLNLLDKRGYFTPGFKAAVHDLVDTQQAIVDAKAEESKLRIGLPDLQKQAADSDAKTAALRQELARYDHPDENDYAELQARMKDAGAKAEAQLMLAQAYVWAYPASPHQSEAQQDLQQLQKKIADQKQADKDAEAARIAARAKLVQRAQAKDLSLAEWRDFLRDMSQDDLLKYIGRPSAEATDYWTYSGDWTTDAVTQQKVGLIINFNGGRVLSVSETPVAK